MKKRVSILLIFLLLFSSISALAYQDQSIADNYDSFLNSSKDRRISKEATKHMWSSFWDYIGIYKKPEPIKPKPFVNYKEQQEEVTNVNTIKKNKSTTVIQKDHIYLLDIESNKITKINKVNGSIEKILKVNQRYDKCFNGKFNFYVASNNKVSVLNINGKEVRTIVLKNVKYINNIKKENACYSIEAINYNNEKIIKKVKL